MRVSTIAQGNGNDKGREMPTDYILLDETFVDGSEVQVDIDRDEHWFVTLNLSDVMRPIRQNDGTLCVEAGEAEKIGEALINQARAAKEANAK